MEPRKKTLVLTQDPKGKGERSSSLGLFGGGRACWAVSRFSDRVPPSELIATLQTTWYNHPQPASVALGRQSWNTVDVEKTDTFVWQKRRLMTKETEWTLVGLTNGKVRTPYPLAHSLRWWWGSEEQLVRTATPGQSPIRAQLWTDTLLFCLGHARVLIQHQTGAKENLYSYWSYKSCLPKPTLGETPG